jgi:hypothetical protein
MDKRVLLSHKDYSNDIRLSVTKKIEEYDLFLRLNGKSDQPSRLFSFPEGFVPDPLSLEHYQLFATLRPHTWYAVEDIVHQNIDTSSREPVGHLQDTYQVVRHLLAKGFFADVTLEENSPDPRSVI